MIFITSLRMCQINQTCNRSNSEIAKYCIKILLGVKYNNTSVITFNLQRIIIVEYDVSNKYFKGKIFIK